MLWIKYGKDDLHGAAFANDMQSGNEILPRVGVDGSVEHHTKIGLIGRDAMCMEDGGGARRRWKWHQKGGIRAEMQLCGVDSV